MATFLFLPYPASGLVNPTHHEENGRSLAMPASINAMFYVENHSKNLIREVNHEKT